MILDTNYEFNYSRKDYKANVLNLKIQLCYTKEIDVFYQRSHKN